MSGFQAAAGSGSVMILVIALLRLTAGKRLPRALFPALCSSVPSPMRRCFLWSREILRRKWRR